MPMPQKYWARPEDKGYAGDGIEREYATEGLRAYFSSPNYLKTVGPDLGKELRKLNEHPLLKNLIQFNGLGAGLMADERFQDAWREGNGA